MSNRHQEQNQRLHQQKSSLRSQSAPEATRENTCDIHQTKSCQSTPLGCVRSYTCGGSTFVVPQPCHTWSASWSMNPPMVSSYMYGLWYSGLLFPQCTFHIFSFIAHLCPIGGYLNWGHSELCSIQLPIRLNSYLFHWNEIFLTFWRLSPWTPRICWRS